MALVASHLLGELWAVGRARHLGGPVKLDFVTTPTSREVTSARPDAWTTFSMSSGPFRYLRMQQRRCWSKSSSPCRLSRSRGVDITSSRSGDTAPIVMLRPG
jgi:hypothetical protein